jgi:hypothetical protein
MSSDSSGRYQSRLFKFLNRQSVRLSDRFDRTVRNIKVAAVWGVQILLYPMYLLVQGGLSVGRQLTAEAEAGWPKLKEFTHKERQEQPPQETPPESDTPIQRVLSEVNTLSLPEVSDLVVLQPGVLVEFGSQGVIDQQETTNNGQLTVASTTELAQHQGANQNGLAGKQPSCSRYAIQGVASLLATRSLVLVTVENQILDILTPQQQQKLASKISWEVANLFRQWRLVQSSQLKTTTPRLSTLDQPRVFLPLRIFWKVMAWVQASPVAIAANVFQESSLVGHEISSPVSKSQPQLAASHDGASANRLAPQTAIAFLDRAIADLESHQLVPGTEALIKLRDSLQDRWNLSPLANVSSPDAKGTLAASRSANKIQAIIRNLIPSPQDSDATPEASQKHSFQIQALIYAAIDYFFGRRGSNLSETDSLERLHKAQRPPEGMPKAVGRSQIPGRSQGNAHQLYGHHSPSLSPAQADAGEPDPWLSWDDLFGNPDISDSLSYTSQISQELEAQSSNSQFHTQLPEAFNSKMPIKPGNSVWQVFKRVVSPQPSPSKRSAPGREKPTVKPPPSVAQTGKLTTRKKTPPLATPAADKGRNITKQPQTPSSINVASRRSRGVPSAKTENTALTTSSTPAQDSNLEPSPDWIETKATSTGYVKHPLERVLGWLDFAMLWLEEFALKIWRLLRRLRD